MLTQKEYCGHWSDDDLSRTLKFKLGRLDEVRRTARALEDEAMFIQYEQRERILALAS